MNPEQLSKKKCVPCEGYERPMSKEEAERRLGAIQGWSLKEGLIEKEYKFKNFNEALEFVNEVGKIAEEEGHHPEILLGWGKAKIMLWTHAIKGLSENDFILAAKIDKINQKDFSLKHKQHPKED